MAEFYLKSLDPNLEVYSAGTDPAGEVHPLALETLKEAGIDSTGASPKNLDQFLDQTFDYVITVCGNANDNCPAFSGQVKHKIHIGFADPAALAGSDEEIKGGFKRIFGEIKGDFLDFYQNTLHSKMQNKEQ